MKTKKFRYYNSVGSKEGWTPSTFVSSRNNRVKDSKTPKQMRPEDYMDEEDLREAEETRQLQTSDTFAGFGTEHDESRRDALMDLFRPPGETVGTKLLRKMGWQEGHQIGGSNLDGENASVTFEPKNDRKGLGFGGEDSVASNFGEARSPQPSQPHTERKKTQKSAFGVGVLNDTGSDDEDPYSMGPQISYNRVIGGENKTKQKKTSSVTTANPTLKSRPVFLSKKLQNLQGALRKCHDGRLPLDGFVLGDDLDAMASLSLQNDKYAPPDVPADWKSSLTPAEDQAKGKDFQSVSEAAKSSTLDAKSRATLLGEAQLPGKSVFDFLSPAARHRLAQASGKSDLPPALSEKAPDGYQTSQTQTVVNLQDLVPKLDQDIALQALNRGQGGWMPYSEDECKRERYKTYLEIRAGLRATSEGDEIPPRAVGMRQEDWMQEMREFARAAQVFKPVTGDMASRFTSSTANLRSSSDPTSSVSMEALLSRPKSKPEDPAEAAAKMGMFGQMTRSVANFYPTRLVCKRFNVPMPEHVDIPQHAPPAFTADFAASLGKNRFQSAGFQEDEKVDPSLNSKSTENEASTQMIRTEDEPAQGTAAAIDPERNEALEKEKPGQALFKAIFGSDDEDEDEDM